MANSTIEVNLPVVPRSDDGFDFIRPDIGFPND